MMKVGEDGVAASKDEYADDMRLLVLRKWGG